MRKLFIVLFFFRTICLFGQVEVELFFYDSCKDSIIQEEFELMTFDKTDKIDSSNNFLINIPSNNVYFLSSGINRNQNMIGNFDTFFEINQTGKYKDTIFIPKILFASEMVLHSTNWNYFNCNKLCDGEEVDYHQNGNIRTKGVYKEGKPNYIFEYGDDGIIDLKTWYETGTMNYLKVEYYDEIGNLDSYETHKFIKYKRRTKIKVYNSQGKFLSKRFE